MPETNQELLDRYKLVEKKQNAILKRIRKIKPGPTRDNLCRNAGCWEFTLLQIESKLRERGLAK